MAVNMTSEGMSNGTMTVDGRLISSRVSSLTSMDTGKVSVSPAPSMTRTVNIEVPGVSGVPDSSPEDVESVRPDASCPSAMYHWYGDCPPLA